MRWFIKPFLALSGATALEITRQPVTLLLALSTVTFIGVLPLLLLHTLGSAERLVRDSSLALMAVSGLLLASLAAGSTLRREIERGTAASILSKPVSRGVFFLSKFAGLAAVLVLYGVMTSLATLLAMRTAAVPYAVDGWGSGLLLSATAAALALGAVLHYFTGKPFMSGTFRWLAAALVLAMALSVLQGSAGEAGAALLLSGARLAPAFLLLVCMLLVLAAVALSLAVHGNAQTTTAVCVVVFLLGLISDYVFGRRAADSFWAALGYGIIPNWQHFWVANALNEPGTVPWAYALRAAGYAVLYLAGVLSLGLATFRRAELKA